ncbi:unnamed protein product, partial [Rotaria magnacalcarata]
MNPPEAEQTTASNWVSVMPTRWSRRAKLITAVSTVAGMTRPQQQTPYRLRPRWVSPLPPLPIPRRRAIGSGSSGVSCCSCHSRCIGTCG